MVLSRCAECSFWVTQPQPDCPECGGKLDRREGSGRGKVFSYTVNHHSFNPEIPTPYVIAIVELQEQDGLRVAARIDCDPESVHIGLSVQTAGGEADGWVFNAR
ncbi:OB-fold domain-containing protein [Mycobacterium sp. 236(2023)]|uniref:Zn-ribbon domain-containing OB-fold protein n=1 Tax=Mycobacterium sp. 236(2023) TaxID=3038163 RepID=UPI003241D923